tara:strand:- start:38703 stop:40460 length:1758 start_codon:yes stop_codon:yes gene_type:complete
VIDSTLNQAAAAYQNGAPGAALEILNNLEKNGAGSAASAHLSALCLRASGDLDSAIVTFGTALDRAPGDLNIISDLGYTLLARLRYGDALTAFNAVLEKDPSHLLALKGTGRTLLALGRSRDLLALFAPYEGAAEKDSAYWNLRAAAEEQLDNVEQSQSAFAKALSIEPRDRDALLGQARLALASGRDQAADLYKSGLAIHANDPDMIIGYAEALEAGGDAEAATELVKHVHKHPEWVEGQAVLMRMRFEAGDPDYDRDIASAAKLYPGNIVLQDRYAALLAGAGENLKAAEALAHARKVSPGQPALLLREATYRAALGELDSADALINSLPADAPEVQKLKARQFLRRGDASQADSILEGLRRATDTDVETWALTGITWRLLDDDRALWLHGQDGLIALRSIELDPPELEQIQAFLQRIHKTQNHPIGQSLRSGTQTRGRLFIRYEHEAKMLATKIRSAVIDHWNGLPKQDPQHPLLRYRDRQPRITGSWSVRLLGSGFHVPHIHPQGIFSSASYWILPAGDNDAEGQLEIGRPPSDLNVDLEPVVTLTPKIGHLALFPSSLYHGTTKFRSGERITAAFDVIPE